MLGAQWNCKYDDWLIHRHRQTRTYNDLNFPAYACKFEIIDADRQSIFVVATHHHAIYRDRVVVHPSCVCAGIAAGCMENQWHTFHIFIGCDKHISGWIISRNANETSCQIGRYRLVMVDICAAQCLPGIMVLFFANPSSYATD